MMHFQRMRLGAALAWLALAAGCAHPPTVTLSNPRAGLALALPAGFVDMTQEARREQARRADDGPLDERIAVEPLLSFAEEYGARGCQVNLLGLRDNGRLRLLSAEQMVHSLASLQQQQMAQPNPWALLAQGQRLGAWPGDRNPSAQTTVASRAIRLGPWPGWMVMTEHAWPVSPGPVQGRSRLATIAAEWPALDGQRRWVMVHCGAAHMGDYLPSYMDDMIDALAAGQWPAPDATMPR